MTAEWPIAPVPTFSSGTEWELWSARNCWVCVHDDGPGSDPGDGDLCCPIIGDMLCHTPNDALRREPGGFKVVCRNFAERKDERSG